MPAGYDPSLSTFSALLVCAAAGVVIWWCLYGDRARGARRCPQCWHDLSGTPGLTCGECGFRALDESQLHGTRRRWKAALVTMLVMLGGVSVIRWNVADVDWVDVVPDRLLIALIPWSDGDDQIAREIGMRINAGEFNVAEMDAVLAACLAGSASAPPGSEAWERRYQPLLAPWLRAGGFASDAQRRALMELPCRVSVEGPLIWPFDAPTRVHVRFREWWPSDVECRLRLRRAGAPSDEEIVALHTDHFRLNRLAVPVDALPEGTTALEFEAVVERRRLSRGGLEPADVSEAEAPWVEAGRGRLSLEVGRRADVADALEPVDEPVQRAAMHSAFSGQFLRWSAGERRFGVLFNPTGTSDEVFRDVAIGLLVEVLEDGVPRRRSALWWMGGPRDGDDGPRYAWEILEEDADALDRAQPGDPRWTLRVTGDPEIATRATAFMLDAPRGPLRYYEGSIEMPLNLMHRQGPAPPRTWRVERGAFPQ